MDESEDEQNKFVEEYNEEEEASFIDDYDSNFRNTLIQQVLYFSYHSKIYSSIKFIIGLIFILGPFISFLILITKKEYRYIILGFFISFTFISGFLILLLVFKLGDDINIYGLMLCSWERLNICKIIDYILYFSFVIVFFSILEKFLFDLPLLKGTVIQVVEKDENSKILNEGSFIFRILFISFFWDANNNSIGYFEFDESFSFFRDKFKFIFISFILIYSYKLLISILFKIKRFWYHFIISICGLFECFFFLFYPFDNKNEIYNQNEIYFVKKNGLILIELLPLFIMILTYIFLGLKDTLGKYRKKGFFLNKALKTDKITFYLSLISFSCILIGYSGLIGIILYLSFKTIDNNYELTEFTHLLYTLCVFIIFLCIGYSFIFGHKMIDLIYEPIAFEIFDYPKKKDYYINYSLNSKRKKSHNSINYLENEEIKDSSSSSYSFLED